jgi:hypothetical protein
VKLSLEKLSFPLCREGSKVSLNKASKAKFRRLTHTKNVRKLFKNTAEDKRATASLRRERTTHVLHYSLEWLLRLMKRLFPLEWSLP